METTMSRRSFAGFAAAGVALRAQTPETTEDEREANKAVVRRWFAEVINQGLMDVVDELIASDFQPQNPDDIPGPDALKQRVVDANEDRRTLIPDIEAAVDDLIAERDMVSARLTWRGSSFGGNDIAVLALSIFQLRQGQIVASWNLADDEAFLRQMAE